MGGHSSKYEYPRRTYANSANQRDVDEDGYMIPKRDHHPPPPPPPLEPLDLLKNPWRNVDWKNKEGLLESVKDYDRKDEKVQLIRILLHGPIGAGKSSFINAVSSCLQGRMIAPASVDTLGDTTFTIEYQAYNIKIGKEQYVPIVFNDIMGLEENDGILKDDLTLAMKGHVKDGYKFNPKIAISEKDTFYNRHPAPEDKVHVLVCVVPADQVALLSDEVVKKIREVRLAARNLGIPQICIITKIDVVHELMEEDLKNVYRMKIVKEKMKEFSDAVGIPMTSIFPVKNYHEETDLEDDADVLILKALKHMIDQGEIFIDRMKFDTLPPE